METILSNLPLVPFLLGHPPREYDLWYSINLTKLEYAQDLPEEQRRLRTKDALDWLAGILREESVQLLMSDYVAVRAKLKGTSETDERRKVLAEESMIWKRIQA